jgi:hypothetical protein
VLRAGGFDELRPDPEPQPPDAELREAAKSTGGKGLAIIGADAVGEAVLTEQPAEHYLGRLEERALEPFRSLALAIRLVYQQSEPAHFYSICSLLYRKGNEEIKAKVVPLRAQYANAYKTPPVTSPLTRIRKQSSSRRKTFSTIGYMGWHFIRTLAVSPQFSYWRRPARALHGPYSLPACNSRAGHWIWTTL